MIKAEENRGKGKLHCEGTPTQIMAELVSICKQVMNSITEDAPEGLEKILNTTFIETLNEELDTL